MFVCLFDGFWIIEMEGKKRESSFSTRASFSTLASDAEHLNKQVHIHAIKLEWKRNVLTCEHSWHFFVYERERKCR